MKTLVFTPFSGSKARLRLVPQSQTLELRPTGNVLPADLPPGFLSRPDVGLLSRRAETWFTEPLKDHPKWTAAYRLVPQSGSPIIAEMRLYPTGRTPPEDSRYETMPASVPKGGITRRLVREVPVGQHLVLADEILADLRRAPGWASELPPRRGFRRPAKVRGRQRAADTRDQRLAEVAAIYDDAVTSGKRPIPIVAQAFEVSASRASMLVTEARKEGMLSETRRGVAGGLMTQKARDVRAPSTKEGTQR